MEDVIFFLLPDVPLLAAFALLMWIVDWSLRRQHKQAIIEWMHNEELRLKSLPVKHWQIGLATVLVNNWDKLMSAVPTLDTAKERKGSLHKKGALSKAVFIFNCTFAIVVLMPFVPVFWFVMILIKNWAARNSTDEKHKPIPAKSIPIRTLVATLRTPAILLKAMKQQVQEQTDDKPGCAYYIVGLVRVAMIIGFYFLFVPLLVIYVFEVKAIAGWFGKVVAVIPVVMLGSIGLLLTILAVSFVIWLPMVFVNKLRKLSVVPGFLLIEVSKRAALIYKFAVVACLVSVALTALGLLIGTMFFDNFGQTGWMVEDGPTASPAYPLWLTTINFFFDYLACVITIGAARKAISWKGYLGSTGIIVVIVCSLIALAQAAFLAAVDIYFLLPKHAAAKFDLAHWLTNNQTLLPLICSALVPITLYMMSWMFMAWVAKPLIRVAGYTVGLLSEKEKSPFLELGLAFCMLYLLVKCVNRILVS